MSAARFPDSVVEHVSALAIVRVEAPWPVRRNPPACRDRIPRMSARRPAFVCAACGATHSKWSGRCDACGAWNTHRRGADRPRRRPRRPHPRRRPRPQGRPRRPRGVRAAAAARPLGHRRARPRARRRPRAGLRHPRRRRSRHRQVDAAAAGRRRLRRRRRPGDLRLRRGGDRPDPPARRPPRPRRRPGPPRGRDQPPRHPHHARGRAPGARHHRLDPDDVGRPRRQRPGLGRPGPRRRARAHHLRQAPRGRR